MEEKVLLPSSQTTPKVYTTWLSMGSWLPEEWTDYCVDDSFSCRQCFRLDLFSAPQTPFSMKFRSTGGSTFAMDDRLVNVLLVCAAARGTHHVNDGGFFSLFPSVFILMSLMVIKRRRFCYPVSQRETPSLES